LGQLLIAGKTVKLLPHLKICLNVQHKTVARCRFMCSTKFGTVGTLIWHLNLNFRLKTNYRKTFMTTRLSSWSEKKSFHSIWHSLNVEIFICVWVRLKKV